jgi:hypothetical protein
MKTNAHRISHFVQREWPNLIFWSLFIAVYLTMLILGLTMTSMTGPQR